MKRWKILLSALPALLAAVFAGGDEVEKIIFLVLEPDGVIASNTKAGRIDRLDLRARERLQEHKAANAVAVVVTNQRFAGYSVLSGWQSKRIQPGEEMQSLEVEDYSATVVTNDRILNFYGRTGVWAESSRSDFSFR